MCFFGEMHVFLQLSRIGLFGTEGASLSLEKPTLQEVFLSNITQLVKGNNALDAPASNTDGLLSRETCFFNLVDTHISKKMSLSPH
jgi:hypothetical protein